MLTGIRRMGHTAGETFTRGPSPRLTTEPDEIGLESQPRGVFLLVTGALAATSGYVVEFGGRSAPQRTTVNVSDLYVRRTSAPDAVLVIKCGRRTEEVSEILVRQGFDQRPILGTSLGPDRG